MIALESLFWFLVVPAIIGALINAARVIIGRVFKQKP